MTNQLLVSKDEGWGYIHIAADIPPCTEFISSHDSAASAVAAAIAATQQLQQLGYGDNEILIFLSGLPSGRRYFALDDEDDLDQLRRWSLDYDKDPSLELSSIDWDEF